jgi:DNA helicase-2/ATP-dependent DNA helicase PcrA
MDLNPAQYDAVTTLAGPLLVLAGAGTGKTRVVTYRIAELIRNRIRPERILAVTFTNKAADEMQQRTAAMLGKKLEKRPEMSTFHSLCVRILHRHIHLLGYPTNFAIYDRGDQEGVARTVLREIRAPDAMLRPGDLIYLISRWKSASVRPEEAATLAQTDREHLAAAGYRRYQNALKAAGALDFDDMLLCTEDLFAQFPKARKAEADRFDHLLVDEYQDTNGSQYRIVKALAAAHRNLCVVGDDDQSIYGWRGAEVAHILRFKSDWPDAKVVRLEINYRSTREIVEWSNRLIAFNKLRHGKVLRATCSGEPPRILQLEDEEKEAKTVVGEIAARMLEKKRHPRDFAILCRTNEQPRAFEMELRRQKIPYVLMGGMSFYDRKEIRDILAYVKLLAHPSDEVSLLRIINLPARGISQTTVKRLMEEAIRRGRPLWEVLPDAGTLPGLSPAAVDAIGRFRAMIERFQREVKTRSLADVLKTLIREINYKDELTKLYPNAADQESRWASVEELVNAAAAYSQRETDNGHRPAAAGFLQEVALTGDEYGQDKETKLQRDAVALMTLHAAKGLEFREVYMVGMEEGTLPHHRSIAEAEKGTGAVCRNGPEGASHKRCLSPFPASAGAAVDEERRLCYVGVTRAQRRLTLTLALNRFKWGKSRPTIPSRFLYELTGRADNPNYQAAVQGQRKRPAHSTSGIPTSPPPRRRP